MSTMFIGGRRVQLRVVFFVVTVFVFILIFTASSTKLQDSLNTFKQGYKYGSDSTPDPNAPQTPSTSPTHQDETSKPAKGSHKMATDPCVAQELPEGGTTPRHVQGTKVLVTGGAGFIGSNLVDTLLELGYKVRIFDNLYTGFIRNVPLHDDRVEFMFGDIMDPAMLEKAVVGVEYVFHLAAMSKVVPSLKNPEMARFCVEANALGTWNVLNAVRDQGKIKKVIYAASSTYYGNNPPPHNEDMAPDFLTPYAASKYEGELQMQMFDRLFSVPTISTRFFMVYGPRQPSTGAYAIVTGVFAKQAADGKQLTIEGDGSHYRDFIHVKDIVNGLILSQQHPELHGNVVNLGTGTAFTVQDVADLVSPDQKHVDARKNDLEGTLADTCRMKKLLGYKAGMDFKKEMSYMVDQTMKGNVFMQQWLKPAHALSAPHLLAPGTPVFQWPKKQNDLDGLLTAIQNIKVDSANDRNQISVIPFSIGSNNASVITDLMLNTVFSLVRFGEVSAYIVTAMDKTALETCISLNLPCYDATSTSAPETLYNLLKQGYNVHYAELGNSYTSPVSTFFESLSGSSEADLYQATPYGDVFIRSSQKTTEAIQSWSIASSSSIPGNMLFIPSTWPESLTLKKSTYSVESLCDGKIGGKPAAMPTSQSSSTENSSTDSSEKAKALADNKNPEKSYEKEIDGKGTPKAARSESLAGFCDKSRFYVPVGCGTENEAGVGKNAPEVKAALQKTTLWHLTECADKLHCDIQQSVPFRWLEKTPDLKERGGMC